MTEEKVEKAGKFALLLSFVFPIVGVVCYVVYRKRVANASSYLWNALAGFAIDILLGIIFM